MEVPLVEHGSLMLRAAQRTSLQPNIALVTRFNEDLPRRAIEAEARRLAAHPFRLGRRLRSPRVPGARPRWQVSTDPPPVDITRLPAAAEAGATGAEEGATSAEAGAISAEAAWLDDQMSVRHDPEQGPGWRLSATRLAGGGTMVVLGLSHLFGTGRDLVTGMYGGLPDVNLDELPPTPPWFVGEPLDLVRRTWTGVRGGTRLAAELATYPWRRRPYGELASLGLAVTARRDRDPSRGRRSHRRVAAVATIDAAAWDSVAEDAGGTSTSLLVALGANLARAARIARGGSPERPVRLIVPIDLADRNEVPDVGATLGPIRLTSATVVLPGGRPARGDLKEVRAITRGAFADAATQVAQTGRVPVAPGVIDALKLLPDEVSQRAVFEVHSHYDAAASNVGPLPDGILRLEGYTATDAVLMAFPLGSDVSVTLARHGGLVQVGVIADPSRLGGGPPLRERLSAELKAWALPDGVW